MAGMTVFAMAACAKEPEVFTSESDNGKIVNLFGPMEKSKPDKNNIRPDHDKDTPAKEEKKPSATKSPNEAAVKDNENPGKDNASQGEKPGKGNQPQEDE